MVVHRPERRWTRIFPLAIALVFLLTLLPLTTRADSFVVDRTDDDPTADACTAAPNDCSLRGAIIKANNNVGLDIITLPAGTYLLDEPGTNEGNALDGDLDINDDLAIIGDSTATTIVDGNAAVTGEDVFTLYGGNTAEFIDITIQGGTRGVNASGALTLTDCVITDNHATSFGGGIYSEIELTLNDSVISNNSATIGGGGIYLSGGTMSMSGTVVDGNQAIFSSGGGIQMADNTTLSASFSAFSNNTAHGGGAIYANGSGMQLELEQVTLFSNENISTSASGGAIYFGGNPSALTITDSAFDWNTSGVSGGALTLYFGASGVIQGSSFTNNTANSGSEGGGAILTNSSLTIENSTFSGNSAKSHAGAIFAYYGTTTVDITHSTFANNIADSDSMNGGTGGAIFALDGTVTLTNSIVAANSTLECNWAGSGSLNSGGYNLDTDGSCNLTEPSDQPSTNALLDTLGSVGGEVPGHALLPGSPAVDIIPAGVNGCGTTYIMDQRGWPRPIGAGCDAGAIEAPLWTFMPLIAR